MHTNLNENLVPAKLKDLKLTMKEDPELAKFIKTKAKNLPDNYRLLVEEHTRENSDKTLYDLMTTAMMFKRIMSLKLISLFTKTGNKITGFAAYTLNRNNEVSIIRMFSLIQNPNTVLLRDFRLLLEEVTSKYEKVSWYASKNDPANKIYRKAIMKYNGTVEDVDDCMKYTILSTTCPPTLQK